MMSLLWAIACCLLLCRKLWKHRTPLPPGHFQLLFPLDSNIYISPKLWADHHLLSSRQFPQVSIIIRLPQFHVYRSLSKCSVSVAQCPLGAPTWSCYGPSPHGSPSLCRASNIMPSSCYTCPTPRLTLVTDYSSSITQDHPPQAKPKCPKQAASPPGVSSSSTETR